MSDVRLYHGDALAVLPTLPAGSVDAVVCDPPYGQSNEGYDKGVDPAVWRECFRVCKPNAALISFAGSPTYHRIAGGIEAAGWKVRQMWAWVYRNGFITSAYPKEGFDRLAPAMDPICYATKGKWLLRLERDGSEPWRRDHRKPPTFSTRASSHGKTVAYGHWPRSIVSDGIDGFQYFALSHGVKPDGGVGHPNQKPLALMRWLVDKLPEGAVVLDPYMGSGTTGEACVQTGRNFIGVEISEEYFTIGERRLAAARAACPLFAEPPP